MFSSPSGPTPLTLEPPPWHTAVCTRVRSHCMSGCFATLRGRNEAALHAWLRHMHAQGWRGVMVSAVVTGEERWKAAGEKELQGGLPEF